MVVAAGDYGKLLAWAETNGEQLDVKKSENMEGRAEWSISVSVDDPVAFGAYGSGETIDAAAANVISDLETVGVKLS